MVLPKPQHYTARVSAKVPLTNKVWAVTFTLENPQELHFIAGQSMMLHITDGINRSMSIASPPRDIKNILMCHDVSPMGPGSKWTLGLNVGDQVSLVAPLGMFVLDNQSHRKKVMIATGTGIVPFRSMIMDYLAGPATRQNEVVLYWGLRHEEDIYWREEFEALAGKYPNFHFVLTLSKPTETWAGHRGRVTDHLFVEEKNFIDTDFYLCGSKAMVDEVKKALFSRNVPNTQVKQELFF
ncbi:hypothetical protein HYV22_02630 [Candidatus Gottesmanbacteria bacterium]|nr:hypothetical protein [Candidatus Gottesmanbacteria bacterium]